MGVDHVKLPSRKVALFGVCVLTIIITFYTIKVKQSDNICVSCLFSGGDDTTYVQRKKTLLDACKGKITEFSNRGDIRSQLIVDSKHRLIFCPVAKISSTFWRNVMEVSIGNHSALSPLDIKPGRRSHVPILSTRFFGKAHWMLEHYKSFMFAREPYARLLAVYNDKFFGPNPVYWGKAKMIIRKYRKNPSHLSLSCGHDLTFAEFIKYVISTVETRKDLDDHWTPMYLACAPCEMEYDVIGKLETLSQDLDYILNNYIPDVVFRRSGGESDVASLTRNLMGLYIMYDAHAQECVTWPEVLHRYLRKHQVRGVMSKSVQLPDKFQTGNPVSRADFQKFILEKYRGDRDKTLRKLNRKEALLEAYSQVPLEDMKKLQRLYKLDFDIFGYDPHPSELFGKDIRSGKVKKFYFI